MPYSLLQEMHQRPVPTVKQLQRLIMSRQMQQAIHLLQMPVMELAPIVELELEQNPVLECVLEGEEESEKDYEMSELEEEVKEEALDNDSTPEKELTFDEKDFDTLRRLDEDFRDNLWEGSGVTGRRTRDEEKMQTFLENSITEQLSLFEFLMNQAREAFLDKKELVLAESLIGNLDESGLLTTPLSEIAILQGSTEKSLEKVLKVIQTFDPSGVGGRDLKESLLIQLSHQKKQDTLAYEIIEKHFDDLLHNRIPIIQKGLHCTAKEIEEMVDRHIAKLDLHPGTQLSRQLVPYILPDVTLRHEGDCLSVILNEDSLPRLRLNAQYVRMLSDESLAQDAKEFIRQKVSSAKWLLRNILQRNDTIEKIAESLARWQKVFFLSPEGTLVPLTMKTVADELQMHESTIARAVANKYIDTPRGLLPLRFFFTNAIETQKGEVSSTTVRDMLQAIIKKEDKCHPLSDDAISSLMKNQGIQCARRTVAKYRGLLNIGSAQQRRKFYKK